MPLFAYLDPASTSMIASAVVGAFAAIALVFRGYWYKIKKALTGAGREETVEAEQLEAERS
jgi:hypothetical protein